VYLLPEFVWLSKQRLVHSNQSKQEMLRGDDAASGIGSFVAGETNYTGRLRRVSGGVGVHISDYAS
jgi:hypothetical protein